MKEKHAYGHRFYYSGRRPPKWIFVLVLAWGVVTSLLLFSSLSVILERGHTCIAVANAQAAMDLGEIFAEHGVREKFTFDAGGTHQMLMNDNTTVLIWHDPPTDPSKVLPPNGRSLVSTDPTKSATDAVATLRSKGWTAEIADRIKTSGNDIVIVNTNAFTDGVLVFRNHVMLLGDPPNKRTLLK